MSMRVAKTFGTSLWMVWMVWMIAGCVGEIDDAGDPVQSRTQGLGELFVDTTRNAIGRAETAAPTEIDLSDANSFFRDFGTNQRTCGTCHVEDLGWTITPRFVRGLTANDEIFVFDGSDCLPGGVENPDPKQHSTQLRDFANIRIDLPIPEGAEFTLASFTDPLSCPTPPSAANIRMYRRPLPTVNVAFLATVMWDGRENVTSSMFDNLLHQSNEATIGHARAQSPLVDADRTSIVDFEVGSVFAQRKIGDLDLTSRKGRGGAARLFDEIEGFFIGINDPFLPGFTNQVFTLYRAWEPDRLAQTLGVSASAAARNVRAPIGRGELVYNTKPITITDVAGLNGPNDGSQAPIAGFCGTCHDTPNVGNHSVSLPLDIGVGSPTPVGGLDVARLPTYTFQRTSNGQTMTTTDGGRGLITGKWSDLGRLKGPILRGLASRAPYFHNGAARDLATVVEFYDQRFGVGFTAQEKSDLVAFLNAL